MKSFPDLPLSAKARKFVQTSIASGRYNSPKQVVEDALTLLQKTQRELEARLTEIDAAIDRSAADIRAGRFTRFDKTAVDRIKRVGRERLAARSKKSA